MYNIHFYKDLGFSNLRQKFFETTALPSYNLIKTIQVDGVFNGEKTSVSVLADTDEEFKELFNLTHNVIIECEKQRNFFYFVAGVRQVAKNTITFELLLDDFHTYFNSAYPAVVRGKLVTCNLSNITNKTRPAILNPSQASLPSIISLIDALEYVSVGVYVSSSQFWVLIFPESAPVVSVRQIQDATLQTWETVTFVRSYYVPKKWVASAYDTVRYQFKLTGDTVYDAYGFSGINRYTTAFTVTGAQLQKGKVCEIGTPFTRMSVVPQIAETSINGNINVINGVNSVSIILTIGNKSLDLTQDFEETYAVNESARQWQDMSTYRALEKYATVVGFANSQAGAKKITERTSGLLSFGRSLVEWQKAEKEQDYNYATAQGNGNGRVTPFFDASAGFGVYLTQPTNKGYTDFIQTNFCECFTDFALNGSTSLKSIAPSGVAFVKYSVYHIAGGAPESAKERLKALFENGLFIDYNETAN